MLNRLIIMNIKTTLFMGVLIYIVLKVILWLWIVFYFTQY